MRVACLQGDSRFSKVVDLHIASDFVSDTDFSTLITRSGCCVGMTTPFPAFFGKCVQRFRTVEDYHCSEVLDACT